MTQEVRAYALVVEAGSNPPYQKTDVWRQLSQSASGGLRVSVIDPVSGDSPDVIDLADDATPTDKKALVSASAQFVADPSTPGAWVSVQGVSLAADDPTIAGLSELTAAALLGYDGVGFSRVRVPNITKIASVSASGNSDVWTPATDKKFRLQRGTISVAATAAALTPVRLRLTDGAGGAVLFEARFAVDTTLRGDTQIPFDLGNGTLSTTANNKLVANLDTALATGACVVNVSGVEE